MRVLALSDSLTGLYNRRFLEDALNRELHRAERSKKPFSIIMIDIDHFKRFNDTFGHDAGDFVLVAIARALMKNVRPTDIVCRYGGRGAGGGACGDGSAEWGGARRETQGHDSTRRTSRIAARRYPLRRTRSASRPYPPARDERRGGPQGSRCGALLRQAAGDATGCAWAGESPAADG
jgi:hypothetical protein